ncbi:MAG: hypothetical protein WAU90_06920 [Methyloceanibacter sp.]
MRVASIFGLGVLGVLFAVPAEALTITNTDPDPHTITVKVGSDTTELKIEPQTEVDPPCDKGCTVELESGEQYEMQGGEQVSIEDGVIFVDSTPDNGDGDEGAPESDSSSDSNSSSDQPAAAEPEAPEAPEAPNQQ